VTDRLDVCQALVWCHDAYRLERDNLLEATASGYLLVKLWRPPLGRGLRSAAVDELFARLSGKVGFYARHAHAAPQLRLRTRAGDQGPGAGAARSDDAPVLPRFGVLDCLLDSVEPPQLDAFVADQLALIEVVRDELL
jgi:hypothetical protein